MTNLSKRRKSTRTATPQQVQHLVDRGKEDLPPMERRRKRMPGAKVQPVAVDAQKAFASAWGDAMRKTRDCGQVLKTGMLCGGIVAFVGLGMFIAWYQLYGLFTDMTLRQGGTAFMLEFVKRSVKGVFILVVVGVCMTTPLVCCSVMLLTDWFEAFFTRRSSDILHSKEAAATADAEYAAEQRDHVTSRTGPPTTTARDGGLYFS